MQNDILSYVQEDACVFAHAVCWMLIESGTSRNQESCLNLSFGSFEDVILTWLGRRLQQTQYQPCKERVLIILNKGQSSYDV